MTRNGGGWTLLLTSASRQGWNAQNILDRNVNKPSLTEDFSILGQADNILGKEKFQVLKFHSVLANGFNLFHLSWNNCQLYWKGSTGNSISFLYVLFRLLATKKTKINFYVWICLISENYIYISWLHLVPYWGWWRWHVWGDLGNSSRLLHDVIFRRTNKHTTA